ncbi:hypothetical protein [Nonomuraea sp. NPDC049784]|uniref:hypothetical protein n=1 Tax=Nonomuraea sp. NPDC049784 TaxID=3154361 RepID=UPI003403BE65
MSEGNVGQSYTVTSFSPGRSATDPRSLSAGQPSSVSVRREGLGPELEQVVDGGLGELGGQLQGVALTLEREPADGFPGVLGGRRRRLGA